MFLTSIVERMSNEFSRWYHFFHQYCIICGQHVGSICLLKFMYIYKHSVMKRWKGSPLLNPCYKCMAYFITPNNATPTLRKWNHRVYGCNLPSPIQALTMTTVVPNWLVANSCVNSALKNGVASSSTTYLIFSPVLYTQKTLYSKHGLLWKPQVSHIKRN